MKTVIVTVAAVIVVMFLAVGSVGAQTSASTEARSGVMPILYDVNGNAVNSSNVGSLPTGTYYLDRDGDQPVSYTGGVYYDPATNTYGGSIYNPTGRAGSFSASGTVTPAPTTGTGSTGSVGIPNTGVGDVGANWALLTFSGLAALGGVMYFVYARKVQA